MTDILYTFNTPNSDTINLYGEWDNSYFSIDDVFDKLDPNIGDAFIKITDYIIDKYESNLVINSEETPIICMTGMMLLLGHVGHEDKALWEWFNNEVEPILITKGNTIKRTFESYHTYMEKRHSIFNEHIDNIRNNRIPYLMKDKEERERREKMRVLRDTYCDLLNMAHKLCKVIQEIDKEIDF